MIERDHVGNGTQGHQRQQLGQIRLKSPRCMPSTLLRPRGVRGIGVAPLCQRGDGGIECAAFAQLSAQREHEIEHHANAGEMLARKRAAALVGIDGAGRGWKARARQVVVCDQHLHPQAIGLRDPLDAGDAVIDGDEQIRPEAFVREARDLGAQAVAILEAVWHEIVHVRAKGSERP